MKTGILLAITAMLTGCAYKGDVFIYSPIGDANAIEKAVEFDTKVKGF